MTDSLRLDAIRSLGLDAVPDRDLFSRITLLASTMLGCPIALLSVVEQERQWFLGRTGTDLAETPIEDSFCAVCIQSEQPMLIADARVDPRLADNALVTGAPFIRSYLGVPIRSDGGLLLGALCCIAPEPEAFRPEQIAPLAMLAELAEQSITLHARTRALSTANAALRQQSRIFRQAERAANVGSWRVDIPGWQLSWSDQVYAINGMPPGRMPSVAESLGLYEPADQDMVRKGLEAAVADGAPFSFETTIHRPDGEPRRIRVVGERVDDDGEPECVAGIILDCTEEHLRNVALKRAAERDRLTGLYNRASFDRRLAEAMQRAGEQPVTIALLDLDGFKDVNDTLGHLVGDRVLETIAGQLQLRTATGVFLARWGGDEFALLFPARMTLADVTAFLDELIAELGDMPPLGNTMLRIGATCGVARMDTAAGSEEIMRRADLALYRGKEQGRGAVVCWDEQIEARQCERQHAITRLGCALNSGRAIAAYQPIVELATGRVVAVEALLRLRDEDGTIIAASEIFSALLDPELSRRVSRVMLDQVVADGPAILALFGAETRIAINLSDADLRRGDFVKHLIDVIDDSLLRPHNIAIEVTETMLLDAGGQLRQSLAMLDECGFTICLDDFGTGFSSLTHLRDFPINKVKIDRDFIAAIGQDHQARLIIQAIVQMGHSLGLQVVVEGVETEEQETFLRAIGCRHVQGYRYGRPMLLDAVQARFGARGHARRLRA
ncbi:MAG: EAL domain-containing protein [Erythrobacter sp.]|uniref:putative bifunctional diguanylate cyclase/phosphodiesterase n=1 Tax=Erythrobacter sp. TaxID=1042 RepID=UPI0025F8F779|nr:EAL domain-containing protein [Erythrobacter sp.]MCL9998844.1 EAL domain-containing protein [Erythrobacter sp.]